MTKWIYLSLLLSHASCVQNALLCEQNALLCEQNALLCEQGVTKIILVSVTCFHVHVTLVYKPHEREHMKL